MALLLTAVANTAANRRLTFGVSGRGGLVRHHLQGLLVLGCGLLVTSGALAGLHAVVEAPSHPAEVLVLTVANLAVTTMRFIAMRLWVFNRRPVR